MLLFLLYLFHTYIVFPCLGIVGVECTNGEDTERHLEMGKKFLAAGQFSDALSHYHAAVGKARITQFISALGCKY